MPLDFPRLSLERAAAATLVAAAALIGCGGGNPLGNPPTIENPPGTGGQKLSFAYYQRCINPIFLELLQVNQGGVITTATCASGGCHDTVNGTGGALRIVQGAQPLDLSDAANTPDVIRASDMYKNFYSSQGATVIGAATQSRLLNKPLVQGVLHGGGLIFENAQDPNAKLITYWISHPVPVGADEFSTAAANLFTPPNTETGTCNTQ